MPKTLNLEAGQAFTVERPIPYKFTVNNVDESSETYAATADGTIEQDDTWLMVEDDPIFTADSFLIQIEE